MLVLRPARVAERARLTEIAFAAKARWGYPSEWLELWRDELEVTPETFARSAVMCAELDGELAGVCMVSGADPEAELEGLWVLPRAAGRGVGSALLGLARAIARARGATRLRIVADPNAEGFYLRHGARRAGTVPSRPAGRTLPLLLLSC